MRGIRLWVWAIILALGVLPWTRAAGMVLASLIAHEWAHAFVAKWCGAKVEAVRIGPFGMLARARKLDELHPRLRLCVYAAGPFVNLAIAWWAFTVHHLSYIGVFWLRDLAFYNVVLAGFNLLPLLPLDGGRLAQHFLGNWFGIFRANRFLLRFGRVAAVALAAAGIVQIILFSFNITLLCAAIFLWYRSKTLQPELRLEAFLTLQKKPAALRGERGKKRAKIRPLPVPADLPLSRALERLGWSYLREFRIKNTDSSIIHIPEEALLTHLLSPTPPDTAALTTPLAALAIEKNAHSHETKPMVYSPHN